jgi:hypothetical protein
MTLNDLLPDYPCIDDSKPLNLVSLVHSISSIEKFDDLMLEIYKQIYNDEERICCNYDGLQGKLFYPLSKRLLVTRLLTIISNERTIPLNDNEQRRLYAHCEAQCLSNLSSYPMPQLQVDSIDAKDEQQWISSMFHRILSSNEIKRIVQAKHQLSATWNRNDVCISYARPMHLRWIKQTWLEHFPLNNNDDEVQRWSQCIDWAIDSLTQLSKVRAKNRPSNRFQHCSVRLTCIDSFVQT